jgi:hypothetical protein
MVQHHRHPKPVSPFPPLLADRWGLAVSTDTVVYLRRKSRAMTTCSNSPPSFNPVISCLIWCMPVPIRGPPSPRPSPPPLRSPLPLGRPHTSLSTRRCCKPPVRLPVSPDLLFPPSRSVALPRQTHISLTSFRLPSRLRTRKPPHRDLTIRSNIFGEQLRRKEDAPGCRTLPSSLPQCYPLSGELSNLLLVP